MSKKADTKAVPPKKGTRISKADELVKPESREIADDDLEQVTGGIGLSDGSTSAASVCISQT
jgi:hypothetical protein